jgi:hypothetical protein
MAKKIKYNTIKVMPPRDGNPFSTTYYQQNHQQRQEALEHIQMVVEQISEVCAKDPDMREWIQKPLKIFKISKSNSVYDILNDIVQQLEAGKDFPESMSQRWTKLFKDTPWDIELVEYKSPKSQRTETFNRLFGSQ